MSEYKPRKFSLKEAALLLGISERYLGTLEIERGMGARRNDRGKPVYTAVDIVILQRMGVGERRHRLYSRDVIENRLGVIFGREPWPDEPETLSQAAKAMAWEPIIVRLLQGLQEEERRRRAREWRG